MTTADYLARSLIAVECATHDGDIVEIISVSSPPDLIGRTHHGTDRVGNLDRSVDLQIQSGELLPQSSNKRQDLLVHNE